MTGSVVSDETTSAMPQPVHTPIPLQISTCSTLGLGSRVVLSVLICSALTTAPWRIQSARKLGVYVNELAKFVCMKSLFDFHIVASRNWWVNCHDVSSPKQTSTRITWVLRGEQMLRRIIHPSLTYPQCVLKPVPTRQDRRHAQACVGGFI